MFLVLYPGGGEARGFMSRFGTQALKKQNVSCSVPGFEFRILVISGKECHLIHLTSLRRFSWLSLQ